MIRDQKFKIWNTELKIMDEYIIDFKVDEHALKKEISIYPEEMLIEYTGKKDKHGTEIYEHDIIRYKDYVAEIIYGQENMNGKEYDYNVFGFIPKNDSLGHIDKEFLYNMFLLEKVEVIGNSFENPELMWV